MLNQVINEILWQNVMDSGYPAKIWIKLVKLEIGISLGFYWNIIKNIPMLMVSATDDVVMVGKMVPWLSNWIDYMMFGQSIDWLIIPS